MKRLSLALSGLRAQYPHRIAASPEASRAAAQDARPGTKLSTPHGSPGAVLRP